MLERILMGIIAVIIMGVVSSFIFQNRQELKNIKPRSYKEFRELTGYGRLEYFANILLLVFGAIGVIGFIIILLIKSIESALDW